MAKIFLKVIFPFIILGIFIIAVFVSLFYQELSPEFYFILFLVLIFIFLFSLAVGQRFTQPVKKIITKLNELSAGDLKARVYLESNDEFENLAKIFNQIAEELEKSQLAIEETKKAVEIKVRVRTQEFEETINSLEQKVKDRAKELQKIISELEGFQKASAEKGKQIIELKKEIKKLKNQLEQPKNEEENKE